MRWLVILAAAALFGWFVVANTPPKLEDYPSGTMPDRETYKSWCYADTTEARACTSVGRYHWPLAAGAVTATTWTWGPEATTAVTGRLVGSFDGCADSQMAWTLSGSGGAAAGTLTAQQPIADLHVPISGPAGEVTLGLRRLDSTACGSVVTWEEPGLELPSPRWPWA